MINLEELIQFTELLISVATLFYVLGRNNGKKNNRPGQGCGYSDKKET